MKIHREFHKRPPPKLDSEGHPLPPSHYCLDPKSTMLDVPPCAEIAGWRKDSAGVICINMLSRMPSGANKASWTPPLRLYADRERAVGGPVCLKELALLNFEGAVEGGLAKAYAERMGPPGPFEGNPYTRQFVFKVSALAANSFIDCCGGTGLELSAEATAYANKVRLEKDAPYAHPDVETYYAGEVDGFSCHWMSKPVADNQVPWHGVVAPDDTAKPVELVYLYTQAMPYPDDVRPPMDKVMPVEFVRFRFTPDGADKFVAVLKRALSEVTASEFNSRVEGLPAHKDTAMFVGNKIEDSTIPLPPRVASSKTPPKLNI